MQKLKILKIARFSYFGAGIWKYCCHIWNQVSQFVLLQSLVQKYKSLNLGPKMPDLGIFGLEFENDIAIFEISMLEFA